MSFRAKSCIELADVAGRKKLIVHDHLQLVNTSWRNVPDAPR